MDEATDNLILEILLQDSLEIYENEQAQITRARVQQQDEIFGTPEHSEEIQGYDASVCRHVRRATKDDESSSSYYFLYDPKEFSVGLLALCQFSLTG